jgi:hypothetical protein
MRHAFDVDSDEGKPRGILVAAQGIDFDSLANERPVPF